MTESQKRSAIIRKRAAGNVGPKPTNVKTIVKKPKKMQTGGIYNMTKMRYIQYMMKNKSLSPKADHYLQYFYRRYTF